MQEAADYIRAKPHRIHDLTSAGRLPRWKDGSRVLLHRAVLDAYLAGADPWAVAGALPGAAQNGSAGRLAR